MGVSEKTAFPCKEKPFLFSGNLPAGGLTASVLPTSGLAGHGALPTGGILYHYSTVHSTMDTARRLAAPAPGAEHAAQTAPHGSVVLADYQSAGRGRFHSRAWSSLPGASLLFTVILLYENFSLAPEALTLKAGLAVAEAIDVFGNFISKRNKNHAAGAGRIKLKWPNDIVLVDEESGAAKKICGILTESDLKNVFLGIGVNVHRQEFPPNSAGKLPPTTLEDFLQKPMSQNEKYELFTNILVNLNNELAINSGMKQNDNSWRDKINERLYMKDQNIKFAVPTNDTENEIIAGKLIGINEKGCLQIKINIPRGKPQGMLCSIGGCSRDSIPLFRPKGRGIEPSARIKTQSETKTFLAGELVL
jgi:BirA family biotin operon repressor/biotin-[acetyl-CoA-carboxylase] ligase